MKSSVGWLIALLATGLMAVSFVSGQRPGPGPGGPPPPDDPLRPFLFPPELVMAHQREIGLTEDQKTFIRGEVQRTTARFNELQWQLDDASEALVLTVKEPSVNEQQAQAQLDKVLDAEREIKHLHMGLAIRIKNHLTLEQQAKLQEFKRPPRPPGR